LLVFSLAAFVASFVLIVLAEMGDKTQFLAMSFATRFNAYKVLFAVFLATVANFAITVTIGQLLTTIVPIDVISLAASLSFIGFGLWTLRGERPKSEDEKASRFGVVGTVFVAFFIGEFGDKTQLTTISLAAQYQNAVTVLIGATLGMLAADGLGIAAGVALGKRIPQRTIKWVSATIFLIFGLVGIYEVLSSRIGLAYTALTLVLLIVLAVVAIIFIARRGDGAKNLAAKNANANLHNLRWETLRLSLINSFLRFCAWIKKIM
jgi:Ca2+/H+ antiporter, TMEM165/GDT1 family